MNGTIQQWGDSLAVRIPQGLVDELGIEPGTPVQIRRENNHIVITPASSAIPNIPTYTLEELLEGITPENRHDRIDFGAPQGKELL